VCSPSPSSYWTVVGCCRSLNDEAGSQLAVRGFYLNNQLNESRVCTVPVFYSKIAPSKLR